MTRYPRNPGRVLTKALQLGLTSTAYLTKARTTKATRHLYWGGRRRKGMKKILQEALSEYRSSVRRGEPDAKHLQRTENNIRRNYNKILLNTAVRYGNTETKRKRRREDRKYFNRLADYFGARIRDLGASNFPFPSTIAFNRKGF